MIFINGMGTLITIQLHLSAICGTFYKKGPFYDNIYRPQITRVTCVFTRSWINFPLEPWNLVKKNCSVVSSFRNMISYVVPSILNVREGYPYPPNPELSAICRSLNFSKDAWRPTTKLHICLVHIFWVHFVKSGRFHEEIVLKWPPFRKRHSNDHP